MSLRNLVFWVPIYYVILSVLFFCVFCLSTFMGEGFHFLHGYFYLPPAEVKRLLVVALQMAGVFTMLLVISVIWILLVTLYGRIKERLSEGYRTYRGER